MAMTRALGKRLRNQMEEYPTFGAAIQNQAWMLQAPQWQIFLLGEDLLEDNVVAGPNADSNGMFHAVDAEKSHAFQRW